MNIIKFFALLLVVLSGTMYAAENVSAFEIQVEQTKIPGGMGATGSLGATGAQQKAENAMSGEKVKETSFVTDHDLAKEIYKVIRDDRTISSDSKIKIIVTVFNGKVTLSGVVVNQAEKDRAGLLATQVNKLKSVVNDIKVTK